jgi:hypothetical protein
MLITAIILATPWFGVVADVYHAWAMGHGVSGVATFPRGSKAGAASWW